MDRTLSIRDSRRLAWTPHIMYTSSGSFHRTFNIWTCRIYYFLDEGTAQPPYHSTGNPTTGQNITKGWNRRLPAVDSATLFPPETATTKFSEPSEEAS
ncbi:hypothetical protein PAXINDRAFT_20020 [Paxillus involutus ATCC 200175]|uniref:Uncharacterized protein n=1 Tax=Paxillus involutus ATCC 200175 TaxID=664439 RepID=A0A0C9SMU3_PAXIN|nr:hypothetical protein PAXINDRAFT_20020 [Paxillus involutus ATCC 200175]